MTDFASSLTRTIARDYDLFQASLEFLQKERKFLNYGYTVSGKETYEERQERLCLEVFEAAEIGQGDVVIDVGFGSGEQDFLLSNTCEFSRLVGFNISERQVRYANERAVRENVAHKLSFRLGEAERLLGVSKATLYRWIREGFITAEQITPGAPWRIRIDQALRDRIQPEAPDGWLGLDEAAKALGVARQTVLHKVQRGELQAVHVNRGRRKGSVSRSNPTKLDYSTQPIGEMRNGNQPRAGRGTRRCP